MIKKLTVVCLICCLMLISSCNKVDRDLKYIDCEINSTTDDDITIDRKYRIYYKGNLVKMTESEDIITSKDPSLIKKYSDAYKKIAESYKDIAHYDFTVKTSETKVDSKIVIDYDKVDVDKIIEVEGEEDNIFTDKKVYLDNLKEWTKNHGINCEKN